MDGSNETMVPVLAMQHLYVDVQRQKIYTFNWGEYWYQLDHSLDIESREKLIFGSGSQTWPIGNGRFVHRSRINGNMSLETLAQRDRK